MPADEIEKVLKLTARRQGLVTNLLHKMCDYLKNPLDAFMRRG
jgi:hypothetical protein